MKPGPKNLITDVAGLRVGNASDAKVKSGVTVLVADVENVASVHVTGGAPGTRETDLLAPENSIESVDALVLSGGSAFGLDAASGAQGALKAMGRGFEVAGQRIPIAPAAILFDLANGGNKDWGGVPPYRTLGIEAIESASEDLAIGSVGAGTGALTGGGPAGSSENLFGLKGGLGSASTVLDNGVTVGALVAVNALGATTMGDHRNFWAAPFEVGDEFGGLGLPSDIRNAADIRIKFHKHAREMANTTIGIIATDARLTKAQVKRLCIAAHDGFARAIWPAHTPYDGDLIFGLATGASSGEPDQDMQVDLSAIAASTMS